MVMNMLCMNNNAMFPCVREEDTAEQVGVYSHCPFKGTMSRDFLLLVFFMSQFPRSPRVSRFEFFLKFAEIFASQRHRWCILSCKYLREFSKKIETP